MAGSLLLLVPCVSKISLYFPVSYNWPYMQVDKPEMDPIILKSHDGEVTAVTWYSLQENIIFIKKYLLGFMQI